MAIGLSFLGRGWRYQIRVAGAHVLGGVIGGALIALLIAVLGGVFPGSGWRLPVIVAAAMASLWLGLRQRTTPLGRNVQVPKHWLRRFPVVPVYTAWGLMLGSGLATAVPHSGLLMLAAGAAVLGPVNAAVAGGLFGLTRELVPVAVSFSRLSDVRIMSLIPSLRWRMRKLNLVAIIAMTSALVITVQQ
jgi:hypothetical protein